VHLEVGAVEQARAWLEKGLEFSRRIRFQTLVGHTLNHLSRVLLHLGDPLGAARACAEALPHAHDSGDKWLITSLLAARGMAERAAGDVVAARDSFRGSLEVARSFDGLGFAMEAFVGLADPAFHPGRLDRSVALLSCVGASTLTPEFVARAAREQLAEVLGATGQEALREAVDRGAAMDLEEALALAFEARVDHLGSPQREGAGESRGLPN
jgi:hypothetical protein